MERRLASKESSFAIYRPVIPFTLAGPTGELDFFGLLDTGADETYITRQMANRLGLVVDEKWAGTIESASGEMSVRYGKATIEVTDGAETYRWNAVVGVIDQEWVSHSRPRWVSGIFRCTLPWPIMQNRRGPQRSDVAASGSLMGHRLKIRPTDIGNRRHLFVRAVSQDAVKRDSVNFQ